MTDSVATMAPDDQPFTYAIGDLWPGTDQIRIYAYGSETHYGTMSDAVEFRKFIESRSGKPQYIYRLTKIEEEGNEDKMGTENARG